VIPIRDINPRVRIPFINFGLITACVAIFVFQLSLARGSQGFIDEFGFIPGSLSGALEAQDMSAGLATLACALSSIFVHGGWIHIIGNLLYLRVFGDNVEDRFGHLGYLLFFMFCGLVGSLCQFCYAPASSLPIVGASGAIAGVLGAYITLFPRARVLTLFPAVIFLMFLEVHASAFIGMWCLQQFLNGYMMITEAPDAIEGIAWFAHLGGFGCGVVCALIVRWRRRFPA
jgi:membrane associated rhomboid family serine protease